MLKEYFSTVYSCCLRKWRMVEGDIEGFAVVGCLNGIGKETSDEERECKNGRKTTEGQGKRERGIQEASP
jgi:hypothetical protein